jgi:hypothetical protein
LKEGLSNNFEKSNFQNGNVNQRKELKRGSLNIKIPSEDYKNKQFRERRARSISFADMSQLSNSNNNYFEKNTYNNVYKNANALNYYMTNPNYKMSNGNLSRHRSYSNISGTTTLAKKRSFRKPKVLLSSKEHIRRLRKMKSSSAISFKQNTEENKMLKRRYSIHSPATPKLYIFDGDFYGEDSFSELPPNTLYHELKQAREKEMELEQQKQELDVLDEETIYYDSDSTIHDVKTRDINNDSDDDENNSLLKLLLKYLESSINKERVGSINDTVDRGIYSNVLEREIPTNIMEREIPEEMTQNSFFYENSQYSDEESELHKQEELLESIFNDVIKNFYGYQSKFFTIILKLISFLLYNGGKMELGKQLVKYVLRDKMGINISSSDDVSSFSHDINQNHLGSDDIEYFTLNEIKEAKKHEKRRRNGYKSINRIWMIIHNIFIILFLYVFLTNKQPINSVRTTPFDYNQNLVDGISNLNQKPKEYILNDSICSETTPVTWLTSNNEYQISNSQQSYIDHFTGNIINKNCNQEHTTQKSNKINNWIKEISPWNCLVILECILITAQLGFQYFIMDEIVPFFKPATYTSVLFINQIVNFFVQYKVIWKTLYNDLCLYLFILGTYAMCFS